MTCNFFALCQKFLKLHGSRAEPSQCEKPQSLVENEAKDQDVSEGVEDA